MDEKEEMKIRYCREIRGSPIRDWILGAIERAFESNDPREKVIEFLRKKVDLEIEGNLYVIGFGKAAKGMYKGTVDYFGERISMAIIIVPFAKDEILEYPYLPGNHPLPSAETLESSKKLLNEIRGLKEDDLVLALISGGGSSVFEILRGNLEIERYNEVVRCLMENGANISEINAIRYLFSEVKGGGLLKYTHPAKVIGLIISDVPGDNEDVVASGPTAKPPSSDQITQTLKKYVGVCNIPAVEVERAGIRSMAENHIILRNSDFVNSVFAGMRSPNLKGINLGSGIEGSTEYVATLLVERMRNEFKLAGSPIFIVGGGETSTRLRGSGIGGRNLELALRVLMLMDEKEGFAFASIATDGIDGSSKAMGAIVDSGSYEYLSKPFIQENLSRSNSLEPLEISRDVIFTGPTGNNVADLFVGYYRGFK